MKEANLIIPGIPNLSLVAFYGEKPARLTGLIKQLQACLANHELIDKYIPYQLEQVHGTIIGCEGAKTESGVISKWFYEGRQEAKYINFSGLIDYLQHDLNFPLTIRFGGYHRSHNYNFLSRDRHPYFRSFQLQSSAQQTIPVLIGWSWHNDRVSFAIDRLRRNLQQFNLLHKYHVNPDDIDNDFYLRLGTINRQLTSEETEKITKDIRDILEAQPALDIPITLDSLGFAQYQDLSLTPQTTKIISVAVISSQLEQLYPKQLK